MIELYWILSFIISFSICLVITKLLIKLLPIWGLIDKPDNRRLHKKHTPRGGGIAILVAFTISFLIFDSHQHFTYSTGLLIPLWIIGLISFYDDIYDVHVLYRLLVQIIVVFALIFTFLLPNQLFHSDLPYYVDLIIAATAFVAFVNVYNFMDGMDGLTGSHTIHLSITIIILCLLKYDIILHVNLVLAIAVLTLGATLAFTIYNWHPAHIFLGDVGSITLGLLMGLALMLIAASGERLFVSSIICFLYYISDGGMRIIIRAFKGEKIWKPHLNHFFQQAIRKRLGQKKILSEIILCNYWLSILAILALFYPVISLLIALLMVLRIILKFQYIE